MEKSTSDAGGNSSAGQFHMYMAKEDINGNNSVFKLPETPVYCNIPTQLPLWIVGRKLP